MEFLEKTETGKAFLTRLILAGLIKNNATVNLIFDMHNEYGFQVRKESKNNTFVKGPKTLFPQKVVIFSLNPQSTRQGDGIPDFEIILSYSDIRIEDIMILQDELDLHPNAIEAA